MKLAVRSNAFAWIKAHGLTCLLEDGVRFELTLRCAQDGVQNRFDNRYDSHPSKWDTHFDPLGVGHGAI